MSHRGRLMSRSFGSAPSVPRYCPYCGSAGPSSIVKQAQADASVAQDSEYKEYISDMRGRQAWWRDHSVRKCS